MVLSLGVVATERLTLPLWTADDVAAIAAFGRYAATPPAARVGVPAPYRDPAWHRDFPRPDDVSAASLCQPGDPWGPRSIVRGVTVLGSIGFFGPPTALRQAQGPGDDGVGEVEVGYGLVQEAWGWGFATEALRGLLAELDAGADSVRVRASVVPENKASLRVLAKCGFTQLRGATEDGELIMVRPVPGGASASLD